MSKPHLHSTHPEIVKRLKRASGHLESIVAMIHDGRGCVDVAQQLHAVEKAINQAKKALIRDHIDHCLESATVSSQRGRHDSLAEFKEITKYL